MLELGLTISGAAMFAIWWYLRRKAQATLQWPATRGRVTASDLARVSDNDGGYQEYLRVAYDYVVAGATLHGDRVSMGGQAGGGKAKLARYPAGAEVDVFYDPLKPASAVLERNLPGVWLLLPSLGAFFIIVGAWLWRH
jgi:hypothetical protein